MDEKELILNHFGGNFSEYFEALVPTYRPGKLARCILHNEHNPSFSSNTNTGQWFCHGCHKSGDVFDLWSQKNNLDIIKDFPTICRQIMERFNISNGKRVEQKKKSSRAFFHFKHGKPSFIYDYTDESGKILFHVCRFELSDGEKTFAQCRPGGLIWKVDGIKLVLYHLPEILPEPRVIIIEGEKSVDKLRSLGFRGVTCSPRGAGKWRDEYSQYLVGKDIVIFADNDEAGIKHARQVARSLKDKAKSIKLIEFPDLPPKADVYDFIESYNDDEAAAERIAIMIEGAPLYISPAADEEPENSEKTSEAKSFSDAVLEVDNFLKDVVLPEKKKIMGPFTEEQNSLCASDPGVGKTWLFDSIVDNVSRKLPFGPFKCDNSVSIIYVDAEMSAIDVQSRFRLLSIGKPSRQSPLYIYSDAYAAQFGIRRASLVDEEWREFLKKHCLEHHIKWVILDNISSLTPGLDENSREAWSEINEWLLTMRFAGVSTTLIHHLGKSGTQRGTSSRQDNIDLSIILRRPARYNPTQGVKFIMSFVKSRIPSCDLNLLEDRIYQMITLEDGSLEWSFEKPAVDLKKQTLSFLSEGLQNVDIAAELGISTSYVSRIRKALIAEAFITKNGKITAEGDLFLLS